MPVRMPLNFRDEATRAAFAVVSQQPLERCDIVLVPFRVEPFARGAVPAFRDARWHVGIAIGRGDVDPSRRAPPTLHACEGLEVAGADLPVASQ